MKSNDLKKEENAIILAHNYQIREIQEIAVFVGDSLELCQKAAQRIRHYNLLWSRFHGRNSCNTQSIQENINS